MIDIRLLQRGEEAVLDRVAEDVFDYLVDPARAREFLADPRHHIVVALDEGVVIGFVSAVDYVHPDKRPELWINEVGVASAYRQQGIARQLLRVMLAHARELGCTEAWVLTDKSNAAGMRLYAANGGKQTVEPPVMFYFDLDS